MSIDLEKGVRVVGNSKEKQGKELEEKHKELLVHIEFMGEGPNESVQVQFCDRVSVKEVGLLFEHRVETLQFVFANLNVFEFPNCRLRISRLGSYSAGWMNIKKRNLRFR